jgi:plasmid stabilization system protein ParE
VAKKQVIWSIRAQQDRIAILEYWIERNKSKTYPKKLLVLFNQAADLISDHPKIGKPTNYGNVRFKIVRDYLLFYEEMENRIEILLVWDSRQDPDKLDRLLKK